jgi:predicted transcriptional regulator
MSIKIFDSELKVMEILWQYEEITAGKISKILKEQIGWNPNTTYTVIGKLLAKGAAARTEPNFTCRALVTKEEVQRFEARELVNKLFDGSAELFISAYVNGTNLTEEEAGRLRVLINNQH